MMEPEDIEALAVIAEQIPGPPEPTCPICGAEIDMEGWEPGCGCFEDIHYGKD